MITNLNKFKKHLLKINENKKITNKRFLKINENDNSSLINKDLIIFFKYFEAEAHYLKNDELGIENGFSSNYITEKDNKDLFNFINDLEEKNMFHDLLSLIFNLEVFESSFNYDNMEFNLKFE